MKDNINLGVDKIVAKLSHNIKTLKKINDIYTKADIKNLERGTIERSCDIQFIQYVNEFQLFGIMLGIIDGILDNCNDKISMTGIKEDALKKRKIIADDALENTQYLCSSHNEIISNYPSYELFSKIYEELKGSIFDACKLEFINAYNIGYSNASSYDLEKIFLNYQVMKSSLSNKKHKNDLKVKSLKIKKIMNNDI